MITETCQYMTFKLGDELFAINVAQVREVLEVPQFHPTTLTNHHQV